MPLFMDYKEYGVKINAAFLAPQLGDNINSVRVFRGPQHQARSSIVSQQISIEHE